MRKYKVKDARIATVVILLPIFVLFFLLKNSFEDKIQDNVTLFLFSLVISLIVYILSINNIWSELIDRKHKYEVIRFLYHYNKCVEAFGNKDTQKVKTIYNNRIKDVNVYNVSLNPLKGRIKFGYNIMTCKIEKEIVTPKEQYNE